MSLRTSKNPLTKIDRRRQIKNNDLEGSDVEEENEEEDDEDDDANDDEDDDDESVNNDNDNNNDEDDEENDNNNDDDDKSVSVVNENIQPIEDVDNDEDDEDDEDEDYDEDENYLQKFEKTMKQNVITDFHPELQIHNYDEINAVSRVVRNKDNTIIDPLHQTLPFLTKYEKARILGERAKQINLGATVFVDVEPEMIDGYLIALKEFKQKKIPFIIKRPLPNGGCEYWRFQDLEILDP
jgi:DNA-directed RNA polymerase subunit K/omega